MNTGLVVVYYSISIYYDSLSFCEVGGCPSSSIDTNLPIPGTAIKYLGAAIYASGCQPSTGMRYTFELYEDFSTGKLRRSNSNALSSSLSFWIGNEKSSLLLLLTFYVYFSLKNVTLTMIGRTVLARTATRAVARREMSTAPKMHRAKEMWPELEKTRAPKDHDDLHVRFYCIVLPCFEYGNCGIFVFLTEIVFRLALQYVFYSWSSTLLSTLLSPRPWSSVLPSLDGASSTQDSGISNTSKDSGNKYINTYTVKREYRISLPAELQYLYVDVGCCERRYMNGDWLGFGFHENENKSGELSFGV